jgi:putative ABC transport system permease protein
MESRVDWKPHIRPRLASLRLSPSRENEIIEELAQHLEDRWRELVAGGASENEATPLALAGFRDGDLLARHLAPLRQARAPEPITPGTSAGRLFADLWQDLCYAGRTLRKQPTFALAAILTLALGIGSNAAIFTIVNAILLRPLPVPHSEQLQALYTRFPDAHYFDVSGPELDDIRSRVDAYSGVAGYGIFDRTLSRDKGEAEGVSTMQVTSGFFDVLGVGPVRGRTFTEEEARSGACFAVLSEDVFGAADAIGSTLRLDNVACEVIGVMPKALASVSAGLNPQGGGVRAERISVWTPLSVAADLLNNRGVHLMLGVARLRQGASAALAGAQLQALRDDWSATNPAHYANGHFAVSRPLQEDIVGNQREAWLLLGGAVVFVLLIVCVNIAALLISSGEARRREFAVRHALGANRRRLIRQMVAEAMLLSIVGGLIGIVLAKWILAGLLSLYPQRLPMSQAITIDPAALLYMGAMVVVAGVAIGLIPALHATGVWIRGGLRSDSRTATSSRHAVTARSVLVIGQLAVSVMLLVGALLLIRSYQRLQQIDLGVQPDRVLTFEIVIPRAHQEDAAAKRTLETIEDRLAALPGVESVGGTWALPLASAGANWGFNIDGRPDPSPGESLAYARSLIVMPGVFQALRIPLKRGRLLDERDVTERADRPFVAVINETAARLYWAGDDPIGKTIRFGFRPRDGIQIVGVVGDVRSLGPGEPAPPAVYLPLAQSPPLPAYMGRFMTFVIRTSGNPADLATSARRAVESVDAGLPLVHLRPMTAVVSAASGQPRFTTLIMSIFAGVAFLLAALGLYGILAYNVEQRIREIGVRVALGASRGEVLRLVIGHGMKLTVIGAMVGLPASLIVTRLIRGVLPGVTGADPVTYAAVVALLAASAFMASYQPARRATRVDPLVALRSD